MFVISRSGGGTPGNSSWGCAARFFKFRPYFRPKKCNFLHPFSDQTSKIHIRFKTWSLGRNYVISTRLGKQKLGLGLGLIIQIHFEFAYFSFFLTYLKLKREIRSYTPVVPTKTIPDSRPKWAKCIQYPFPDQNGAKTLPDGAANTNMAYIREYPLPRDRGIVNN